MMQSVMEAQLVKLWYEILNKELRHCMSNVMLTSSCTTKIGKCVPIIEMQIELNMVEECVMDFGFAKDNPRNSLTPIWLI